MAELYAMIVENRKYFLGPCLIIIKKNVNGTVTIIFYANDTIGNLGTASVTVYKDTYCPIITINVPNPYDVFGSTPPDVYIIFTDPNLESKWYQLSNSTITTTNHTWKGFIEEEVWDEIGNGTVTIIFYANNTVGNLGTASVTVYKDIFSPIITINVPIMRQYFTTIPPAFDISIDKKELDSTWYTINKGSTKIYFVGLTGVINENLWLATPNGLVTITFYALDQDGYLGSKDVIVIKEVIDHHLYISIVDQSFSTEEFNIIYFIHNESGYGIDYATLQVWWNGAEVSSSVQNLGSGFYSVSLDPITVTPGDDPILLNMMISADGYDDKNFETFLAVDPDTLEKEAGKEVSLVIIIITIISSVGGIGVAATAVVLLRKRRRV